MTKQQAVELAIEFSRKYRRVYFAVFEPEYPDGDTSNDYGVTDEHGLNTFYLGIPEHCIVFCSEY